MGWQQFIGPATFVYALSASLAGIWWASDLSSRVAANEVTIRSAATTSERIVRLEVLISQVDVQLSRIERKMDARDAR